MGVRDTIKNVVCHSSSFKANMYIKSPHIGLIFPCINIAWSWHWSYSLVSALVSALMIMEEDKSISYRMSMGHMKEKHKDYDKKSNR